MMPINTNKQFKNKWNTARFQLHSGQARCPVRATLHSTGLDLFASENVIVSPRSRTVAGTDVSMQPPSGCYGRIASRSGLALTSGINIGAGVIDADYRGEIYIIMFNHSSIAYEVSVFIAIYGIYHNIGVNRSTNRTAHF